MSMGKIMSKLNLTINELKQGKEYKVKGYRGHVKKYTVKLDEYGYVIAQDDKKKLYVSTSTRFEEVEVVEFEELACFINEDSKTVFFKKKDGTSESCVNNLDYKADGGKLFVKKRG